MTNEKKLAIRKSLLGNDDSEGQRDNNHFDLYAMSKNDGKDSMKQLRFDPKQFTDVPSDFYFHGDAIKPHYVYKNGKSTTKLKKISITGVTSSQLKQAHSNNMPVSSLSWPLIFSGDGLRDLESAFDSNNVSAFDSNNGFSTDDLVGHIFYISNLSVAVYPKWVMAQNGFNSVQILGEFKPNDFLLVK